MSRVVLVTYLVERTANQWSTHVARRHSFGLSRRITGSFTNLNTLAVSLEAVIQTFWLHLLLLCVQIPFYMASFL